MRRITVMQRSNIGVYGMGVMGRNLALNIASKGHHVSVFNRNYEKTKDAMAIAQSEGIDTLHGFVNVKAFMKSIENPKKVIVMVKAGDAVDDVIRTLSPYISPNDIFVDGGNEWYEKTEHRQTMMGKYYKAQWVGMGVSGGEAGARYGASLMPGGSLIAYQQVQPYLTDAAAVAGGKPCIDYIGVGGSGNYVKMVHNGMEYGIMQVIAEAYNILHHGMGLSNAECAQFFDDCNAGINSYLLEITSKILRKKDDDGEDDLIERIADKPKMNGTGTWTVEDAYRTLVSVPSIASAVDTRIILANERNRKVRSEHMRIGRGMAGYGHDVGHELRDAMLAAMHMCYYQGFQLISSKAAHKSWDVSIPTLQQIWKGGCIIRSDLLGMDMNELRFDSYHALSTVVKFAINQGIPCPTFSASLQYMMLCSGTNIRSPANLIQAQRDFFGAHGYERIDKPGIFHTQW